MSSIQHIDGSYFISCPMCNTTIEIPDREINCKIFRCGVYRTNGCPPINPHTPEAECKRLVKENLIWGCGSPFRFDGTVVSKCEYI